MRRLLLGITLLATAASCGRAPRSVAPLTPTSAVERPAGAIAISAAAERPAGALAVSAGASGAFDRMPLDPGDRWVYDGEMRVHRRGDPVDADLVVRYHELHQLVCEAQPIPAGMTYRALYIDGHYDTGIDQGRYLIQRAFRRDRGGLYQLIFFNDRIPLCPRMPGVDASSAFDPYTRLAGDPRASASLRAALARIAARAAATRMAADPGAEATPVHPGHGHGHVPDTQPCESLRLPYPPHTGRTWRLSAECVEFPGTLTPTDARIEGLEMLALPAGRSPAWRLRIMPGDAGPNDRFHEWFGRVGELGHADHYEFEGLGPDGTPDGSYWLSDETMWLTSYVPAGATAAR